MSFLTKSLAAAIVGAVALVGLAGTSQATSISVYSTAVDDSGNLLPQGSDDPHYKVDGLPAFVSDPHPLYAPNNNTAGSSSGWIWPSKAGFPAPGDLTFTTTVNLTGVDPLTAILNGFWGADNEVTDLLINGNSTGIHLLQTDPSDQGPFNTLHAFTTTALDSAFFHLGLNTISFLVHNDNDGGPGAFRTAGLSVTAAAVTPIPPSLLMFLTALGGLGFTAYRRRRGSAAA